MHSEKCPICGGTGIYKEYQNYSSYTFISRTCHGCNGKGWITVPGDNHTYYKFGGGYLYDTK